MDGIPKILAACKTNLGKVNFVKGFVVCFFTGFFVRLLPELLAGPYPIGFDTIYYAAAMKSSVIWSHWSTFFTSTWLLGAVMVLLYNVLRVDSFLLLKIVAPVLFGLNTAGVYWFARKMLSWDVRVSLLAGGFFSVQLASLRISWDLLRNTLGLGILLFALPMINQVDSKRGFACFVLFSLLTVFAHEYAAVTIMVIVLSLVFRRFVKWRTEVDHKRLMLAFSPALAVFLMGIYLRIFPVHYVGETNIISAGDVVYANPGNLFFLVNYLCVKSSVEYYAAYWDLALHVFVLFGLLYSPYLFLVLKGFFRHRVLNVWTGLLMIGSFGCLIVPFCALELWHRWMFMLVYPFTFFAVNGLKKFLKRDDSESLQSGMRISERKVKGLVLLTVLLSGAYLATPVLMNTFNVGIFSVSQVCTYFSFAPTVPYQDVDGVIQAMEWLDQNMDSGSCVVLHHAFLSWGRLYLGEAHIIVHFENDANSAVKVALERGFDRVYLVWWNQNVGWYGITVPLCFVPIEDFGRISVFNHVS